VDIWEGAAYNGREKREKTEEEYRHTEEYGMSVDFQDTVGAIVGLGRRGEDALPKRERFFLKFFTGSPANRI
jgi:hypothetical protein